MIEQIIFSLAKEMSGRTRGNGKKMARALKKTKKEASAPQEDQGKFIAQLLDFSRNGAKTHETEEQPFPDCKWEKWKTEKHQRKGRQRGKTIRT